MNNLCVPIEPCALLSTSAITPTYQVGIVTAFMMLVKTLRQSEMKKLDPVT